MWLSCVERNFPVATSVLIIIQLLYTDIMVENSVIDGTSICIMEIYIHRFFNQSGYNFKEKICLVSYLKSLSKRRLKYNEYWTEPSCGCRKTF